MPAGPVDGKDVVPSLRRPGPRPSSGFSLVEALIGTLIVGTALLGAIPARLAAQALERESTETRLAHGILDTAMARLLREGPDVLAEGFVPGEPLDLPDATGLTDPRLVFTTPGITRGEPTPLVLPVRLELTWTADDGRQRTLELTSATR